MKIKKELREILYYGKKEQHYILVMEYVSPSGIYTRPIYTSTFNKEKNTYYYNYIVVDYDFKLDDLIK